jgi:hypothetical protein
MAYGDFAADSLQKQQTGIADWRKALRWAESRAVISGQTALFSSE